VRVEGSLFPVRLHRELQAVTGAAYEAHCRSSVVTEEETDNHGVEYYPA
jgi:hypothetical protein